MIKKSLLTVFLVLIQTVVFAATNTYTGINNGNWNTASNWSLGTVPTAADDVIIPSTITVNISSDSFAKTVSLSGFLTINNAKRLTVSGDLTVNSGGSFLMPTGSGLAELAVYGNYINNGVTDFWKSTVVIAGDLLSPQTSTLQKQGNIIVGGNIIGDFDTTGGNGTGQIYAVDPNATVTITPNTIDGNVTLGVFPSAETSPLIDLVNLVIYGGSCSFTITDIANVSACSGSNAVFSVITSASSPTYQWQVNISGSGWVDLDNSALYSGVFTASLTITDVTIVMANYKYRAKITSGSCTKNGNYGVLTVNVTPTAPTASATLQPTCAIPTGTITITAPSGMNYSIDGSTYTNTSGIFTSVPAGTYNVTAKNSSGCISSPISVIINSVVTKTWNGASWSPSAPTSANNIIFNADFISTADISGCSCQVTAGAVIIDEGHTLNLVNGLTVSGGSLTFYDTASLVQTNNVVNTGNITYEKTTSVFHTDYTYWSSPVAPQTLYNLSPNTLAGKFYSYNAATENWIQESSAINMIAGKGYIIRGPETTIFLAPFTASFLGVPNNGNISITISGGTTSNLIGNPYPSAIDADLFLDANNTVIEGTLYFWTHNTGMVNGKYADNDYASYNRTGGVLTAPSVNSGNNNSTPSGKIAAGQGFFATSTLAGGTATFTNAMRVSGNNSQFFKSRKPKVKTTIEKNRVWLNLTNTQGAFKQTLIGYITGATNDYDDRFDGESFDGNEFVDFYSVNQNKNLTIQGRALPFDENDEVPLGYRTTINGAFTINIDQVDGSLTNQAVFIEDKLTNTVTDLKSGNYTFNTVAGTFNDRFVLRYTNTSKTLAAETFDSLENKVLVSNKNKQIKINSFTETIDKVTIYDLLGRQIYQKNKVNNNELSIANLVSSRQTLIVKTMLQNGATVTDKIMY